MSARERCCPQGYTVIEVLAGVWPRTLDRADHKAGQLGDGAHVHVSETEDDVLVVRPKQGR